MNHDHAELIARLRSIQSPHCQHAADAIEALVVDAERYRWLRDQWAPSISKRTSLAVDTTIVSAREALTPTDIDAAIDAAIQEGKA
jgi:hypothetical protein